MNLTKEARNVKSILQGTTLRGHQQQPPPAQQQHTKTAQHPGATTSSSVSHQGHQSGAHDQNRSNKIVPAKKRNILEVFKKPSNAKDVDKPMPYRHHHHHGLDKSELEYAEAFKVVDSAIILNFNCNCKFSQLTATQDTGQSQERAQVFDSKIGHRHTKEIHHGKCNGN